MPPVLSIVERLWEFSGGAPASIGRAGESDSLIEARRRLAGRGKGVLPSLRRTAP